MAQPGFDDFDSRRLEALLQRRSGGTRDLVRVPSQRDGFALVVVGVLARQMAHRRLALHRDERRGEGLGVEVAMAVSLPPDHDGRDLDGIPMWSFTLIMCPFRLCTRSEIRFFVLKGSSTTSH